MSAISLAGSTLAMCATPPSAETEAGFEALSYTPIRGVKIVGELGTQYETTLSNVIGETRPYQQMRSLGELNVQIELIRVADAGQDLFRSFLGVSPGCSYRALRPDGSAIYFCAELNAIINGAFSPTSIAEQRASLAVTGLLVEVD